MAASRDPFEVDARGQLCMIFVHTGSMVSPEDQPATPFP